MSMPGLCGRNDIKIPPHRARRMEFIAEIRASLVKHGGNARLLFRELVSRRRASQLGAGNKWFLWDRTFFEGSGDKFFKRFVDAHVVGV